MTEYRAPAAEMRQLASGVYAYIQPGAIAVSNAGLIVGKDHAVVVDSLTNKYMVESFIAKINEITDKPIRFVINTHADYDHTATNHFFKDAMAICSFRCREETRKQTPEVIERHKKLKPHMSYEGSQFTAQDIVFEKSVTIYQQEREIRIIDLGPGHSQSDTIVFLPKEKVVFCGDLLIIGLPVNAIHGSVTSYIQNLDILASLDANIYVSGHGPVGSKEAIYELHELLIQMRDEARKCFDLGLSYEEAAQKMYAAGFKDMAAPVFFVPLIVRCYLDFRGEEPACPLPSDVNMPAISGEIAKLTRPTI